MNYRVRYSNGDISGTELECQIVGPSKDSQLSCGPLAISRSTSSIPTNVEKLSTGLFYTRSLSTSTISTRKKRFYRYFKQVPNEECVLYYYRCALVREVLLQGHLYVTPNYFGFYSNVLGYVTKLLIPMTSVIDINKEKMIKFIPNAIVIATEDKEYTFCSLFWKDSIFKSMKKVWRDSTDSEIPLPIDEQVTLASENRLVTLNSQVALKQVDSDVSESDTNRSSGISITSTANNNDEFSAEISKPVATMTRLQQFYTPGTIINTIIIVLLAALYVSAALMMIRIDQLHQTYLNNQLISSLRIITNHSSRGIYN